MKKLQWAIVLVLSLYLLYTVKSAAGINISRRYHAIDLVKLPLRTIRQTLN